MMGNTSINYTQMSDTALVAHIGRFIKHKRTTQNKTQEQLAKAAGLNRWTMGQIENGESITLSSLIQILRALDCLYALEGFDYSEEISPLEYVKLKKRLNRKRVSNKASKNNDPVDLGW